MITFSHQEVVKLISTIQVQYRELTHHLGEIMQGKHQRVPTHTVQDLAESTLNMTNYSSNWLVSH